MLFRRGVFFNRFDRATTVIVSRLLFGSFALVHSIPIFPIFRKLDFWVKQPPLMKQITSKFRHFAWTYGGRNVSIKKEVSFFWMGKKKGRSSYVLELMESFWRFCQIWNWSIRASKMYKIWLYAKLRSNTLQAHVSSLSYVHIRVLEILNLPLCMLSHFCFNESHIT